MVSPAGTKGSYLLSLYRRVRKLSVPLGDNALVALFGRDACSNRSKWAWSTIPDCTIWRSWIRDRIDARQDLRKKIGLLLVVALRQARSPGRMIASSSAFGLSGGTTLPLA
jgi:hypothetical protein